MKSDNKIHSPEHEEISLLLPWYINKTLKRNELNQVKNHLNSCLVCRIELAHLQKLSTSSVQGSLLTPVARASFLNLTKRIHNAEIPVKQKNRYSDGLLPYFQWFAKLNPKNLMSLSPSYAVVSILLISAVLVSPVFFAEKDSLATIFRTLSSKQSVIHKKNEIRLVFTNDITQNQIIRILSSVQGRIVAGPTLQGVYSIRINTESTNSKNLLDIITLLRKNSHVIFAEPAYAFLSSSNIDLQ